MFVWGWDGYAVDPSSGSTGAILQPCAGTVLTCSSDRLAVRQLSSNLKTSKLFPNIIAPSRFLRECQWNVAPFERKAAEYAGPPSHRIKSPRVDRILGVTLG